MDVVVRRCAFDLTRKILGIVPRVIERLICREQVRWVLKQILPQSGSGPILK